MRQALHGVISIVCLLLVATSLQGCDDDDSGTKPSLSEEEREEREEDREDSKLKQADDRGLQREAQDLKAEDNEVEGDTGRDQEEVNRLEEVAAKQRKNQNELGSLDDSMHKEVTSLKTDEETERRDEEQRERDDHDEIDDLDHEEKVAKKAQQQAAADLLDTDKAEAAAIKKEIGEEKRTDKTLESTDEEIDKDADSPTSPPSPSFAQLSNSTAPASVQGHPPHAHHRKRAKAHWAQAQAAAALKPE